MPKRLYEASSQTAVVVGSPNTGVDIVPGNVIKVLFVALADWNASPTTILTSAFYATLLADATKTHAVTPYLDAFEIPKTTPITENGNDNTTYNGVPRLRSTSFATAKAGISAADPVQIEQLRKLASKSGNFQQGTRIGALLLHEGTGATGLANAKLIPVFNIFISDPKKGGLGASDDYDIEFHLEGGWSRDQKMYEFAFEAATLTNPTAA